VPALVDGHRNPQPVDEGACTKQANPQLTSALEDLITNEHVV
jgi:hypothetical protein